MHVTWWMPSSLIAVSATIASSRISSIEVFMCHSSLIRLQLQGLYLQMQVSDVKQLNARELAAWRGFLRVHASLVRDLDRELEEAHGLPLSHYEVLLHLANAPDERMRMSDLASSVLLS